MSLFVMDYDHNSPSPEHLAETHAPFFEIIRKAHPDVPVLFLSRPDTDAEPEDSIRRRDVVALPTRRRNAETMRRFGLSTDMNSSAR